MIKINRNSNKHTVQYINKCSCFEKENDNYILLCTINEKGTKTYTYQKDEDYITKHNGNKLYLSLVAKIIVQNTINDFEKELKKFSKSRLDYLHLSDNCYLLMMNKNGRISIKLFNNVNNLAHYTMCEYDDFDKNKKSILDLAIQKTDRLLTLQLKSYYCEATIDEIHELEKLMNKRILPCLSSKCNKYYAVIKNTIDHQLLEDSGYKFLH